MDEKQLLDYACLRFEEEKYDEALEAFVLAYSKGYEREWILENIYACYMEGNESAFREAYEKQGFDSGVSYEACALDFIPYKDGEYYIFDKACAEFCGKFSAVELERREPLKVLKHVEFSAAAVEFDGNWNNYQELLSEAKKRKIYAVCHDMRKGMSFWKIPELRSYLANVHMFSDRQTMQGYFHKNTAVYLPKIVYGDNQELSDIFNSEHAYRLTPEGRNCDNVLLTIGIPTHDRGHLLLDKVSKLLTMSYDAEIEIAISKNGTHYYQEEYDCVSKMTDARINYVGYNKELLMSENWQNVMNIAHGKYVLFVSDEDEVKLQALEHYLKVLNEAANLGHVRAKTVYQYPGMQKGGIFKCGADAFQRSFMAANYLSGAIYNRKKFLNLNLKYWDDKYSNNVFYRLYPHLWWQMLLSFEGDYIEDITVLIQEGESVSLEETMRYQRDNVKESGLAEGGIDTKTNIPVPSTCEARLEQFWGCIELISDYFSNNTSYKIEAWKILVNKTMYLIQMICISYHYKENEYPEWIAEVMQAAILALQKLGVDKHTCHELADNMLQNVKQMIKKLDESKEINA